MEPLLIIRKGEEIEFSYPIVWEKNFDKLAYEIEKLGIKGKACIVSDSTVAALYLNEVKAKAQEVFSSVDTFVFPAGEENKNLDVVRSLYAYLTDHHYERRDVLIALGGGVTGDLTGFTAATYRRGIDFIQVPTTLLSQVDSSIGGKTGVDFDAYKNMVGAFHQPRLVYMNMSTIHTLPDDQFASGMGEIIKSGLIRNKDLFYYLLEHADLVKSRDLDILSDVICACCKIKAAVVEEDPKEHGVRAILNFGHTIGHAVEKLMNFTMLHGQCVGYGMIPAALISYNKGLISKEDYDAIVECIKKYDLPSVSPDVDVKDVIEATKSDKKMEAGKIKFILLDGIGNAYVEKNVSDTEMAEAMNEISRGRA